MSSYSCGGCEYESADLLQAAGHERDTGHVITVTHETREQGMSDVPIDRRPWRVGSHWGVTVIAEGSGAPDEGGRRLGDSLVATARSEEWAQQFCDYHNELLRQRTSEARGQG